MIKLKKFELTADWATAIGTWVTILLLIVSTLMLWKQIGDLRTSVQNQTYQAVYETEFDLHKYFLEAEHAEFRPYFYGGKRVEADLKDDDPKKIRLDTLAEWWCDFFDDVYQQEKTMETAAFDKWRQFMKDMYQTSPILQEFIAEKGVRWYTENFINDIKCPVLECPKAQ
jgi:hypothetical protein